jgi:hypothetical protein
MSLVVGLFIGSVFAAGANTQEEATKVKILNRVQSILRMEDPPLPEEEMDCEMLQMELDAAIEFRDAFNDEIADIQAQMVALGCP